MALQDIITNLGTAIINLVDRKILKHCEQIETVLLELKAKIDILVEESGSSSGGDTPVTPPDEPTPGLGNRVVYDEGLKTDKVILTKEYLNKYLSDVNVTFIEDLEIWVNPDIVPGVNSIGFFTNSSKYVFNSNNYTINSDYTSVKDCGACLLYWGNSTNELDIYATSEDLDSISYGIGLLKIAGENTTDRDGTDLGSEDFSIGGTSVIVPPTPSKPST